MMCSGDRHAIISMAIALTSGDRQYVCPSSFYVLSPSHAVKCGRNVSNWNVWKHIEKGTGLEWRDKRANNQLNVWFNDGDVVWRCKHFVAGHTEYTGTCPSDILRDVAAHEDVCLRTCDHGIDGVAYGLSIVEMLWGKSWRRFRVRIRTWNRCALQNRWMQACSGDPKMRCGVNTCMHCVISERVVICFAGRKNRKCCRWCFRWRRRWFLRFGL